MSFLVISTTADLGSVCTHRMVESVLMRGEGSNERLYDQIYHLRSELCFQMIMASHSQEPFIAFFSLHYQDDDYH